VRLLDRQKADPGESAWAQIKLDRPLAAVRGDYFVIRSNQATLGGGRVVDPHARRHRRMYQPTLERLGVMETGSDRDILLKSIEVSEPAEFGALVDRANLQPRAAAQELKQMASESLVVVLGKMAVGPGVHVFSATGWEKLGDRARAFLDSHHREYPLRKGAPKEEMRSRLSLTPQIFGEALPLLEADGVVTEDGTLVRRPDHVPRLPDAQQAAVDAYLKRLESDPYSPPTDAPVNGEVLNLLVAEGKVVKVSETVVFGGPAYREMVQRVRAYVDEHGEITVGDVRDLFDTSRKYALALLEHLDQQRITRRVGDARVLR
jgi:selenocysteine-specific elongation factor